MKEIFRGLKIEKTKWDWTKTYPVVMLNMSELKVPTPEKLEANFYGEVRSIAERFGLDVDWRKCATSGNAFAKTLRALHEKHGRFEALPTRSSRRRKAFGTSSSTARRPPRFSQIRERGYAEP